MTNITEAVTEKLSDEEIARRINDGIRHNDRRCECATPDVCWRAQARGLAAGWHALSLIGAERSARLKAEERVAELRRYVRRYAMHADSCAHTPADEHGPATPCTCEFAALTTEETTNRGER